MRWTTRIGHRSQTAARAVQSTEDRNAPAARNRAAAAFAIALDADRNVLPVQEKQTMPVLSDDRRPKIE